MKYLLLVTVLGLGSSFAFANDQGANTTTVAPSTAVTAQSAATDDDHDDRGHQEVRYECFFRERAKAGIACRSWGEVCVDFGGKNDDDRCRHRRDGDRDDDRFRRDDRFNLSCNNGYERNERAFAFIARRDDRDSALIIGSGRRGFDGRRGGDWDGGFDGGWGWGRDESPFQSQILIGDFDRLDRHHDRDLASHVTDVPATPNNGDDHSGDHDRFDESQLPAALQIDTLPVGFFGSCHIRTRDRHGNDVTIEQQLQ